MAFDCLLWVEQEALRRRRRVRGKCRLQLALLYKICNTPLLHSTSWISPICLNNNVKLVYISVKDLLDWYVSIVLFIFPPCYSFISQLHFVFAKRKCGRNFLVTMNFFTCAILLSSWGFKTWSYWWRIDLINIAELNLFSW